MAGRLEGKVAVVVGAGQTPGETIGNGRATAIRSPGRARAAAARRPRRRLGGGDRALVAERGRRRRDASSPTSPPTTRRRPIVEAARRGASARIDMLHNNVGIGAGDGRRTTLDDEA